jgi:hypothetical protein
MFTYCTKHQRRAWPEPMAARTSPEYERGRQLRRPIGETLNPVPLRAAPGLTPFLPDAKCSEVLVMATLGLYYFFRQQ